MEHLGLGIPLLLHLWESFSNDSLLLTSSLTTAQQFRQWIQRQWSL